jgi:hypothetical protein
MCKNQKDRSVDKKDMYVNQNNDLKSRDWLLYTHKKLVQKSAPNTIQDIEYTNDGGARLIIKNISEDDLNKLKFIVNNDRNNNYWYLESSQFQLADNLSQNINLDGFSDIMNEHFRNSDTDGFINNDKLHAPFNGKNIGHLIDFISSITPGARNTSGIPKIFTLVFNPDVTNYTEQQYYNYQNSK